MSGLEGLAALGLACNIFQVISFGRETLSLVKSVYRDGTIDNSLVDKIAAIQGVASNIIDVNIPQSGNQEKKLVDVTKKCTGVARDLQEEIAFLVAKNGQGSLRATLKIAAKANWRKRRLDRMEKALSEAEQLMQTTLLAWIFKSANTASINIDSLGNEVRNFVTNYEQGSREASQLVTSEALQVREVVVRQCGKTEETLRAHITRSSAKFERKFNHQVEKAIREQLQERLLKSLKYPGMNERANQVENAHFSTFLWLFADEDGESDSSYKFKAGAAEVAWISFVDWLRSDLSVYWIMGKPGSGKSTLAKFILSSPRTESTLEKWHPGTIIASHYFWRPGSLLQRSIKGMLCSITHQLILCEPDALKCVSTSVAGINHKDADTDWSVPELQQLCLGLIRHCGKPLCLFIDGLDECGPEDNHQKLLEILEEIRLPNVKLIVSSRNEPIFEKRFRHEPQLRVQDLTAGDLYTYAVDRLPQKVKHGLCTDLVEKAEGVFLWLVLAVQSINRGFSNGDSLEDLRRRIKSLPKGLNDLYKSMWDRLSDDSDLYQESAALYFNLVIADQAKQKQPKRRSSGLNPLEMMLASCTKNHHAFATKSLVSASQLLKDCKEFHERVKARCAGLLALYGVPQYHSLKERQGDTEKALLEYADKWVRFDFIHRSAHDFLVDTVEGQNILRHDRMSSGDIKIRCISASLRAIELLDSILGDDAQIWYDFNLNWQYLEDYLEDLSSIGKTRDSAARELVSRCYELYRSPSLILHRNYTRPARIAAFFGAAAGYPNLNHHCTSIIENRLVGSALRSAVLLSVATTDHSNNTRKLIRWLLSLPEVDVNLKCPLVCNMDFFTDIPLKNMSLGPLDHIKESPFARLLGSGLVGLDWKKTGSTRHRYQFLGLVSDFAFQGADLRSTIFAFSATDSYTTRERLGRKEVFPRFFQIPGLVASEWADSHYTDDYVLCAVAFQATTVIQKMLASLPMENTGNNSIGEDEYSPSEDDYSGSVLETATQFLSRKCQEYSCEANDRVIGFLQPCGNFTDMPYRQVSEQDSAHLMEMILACFFEDKFHADDLEACWRDVVARSPFSSIGFRDYMSDIGCFDGLAAHKLLAEYQQENKYRGFYTAIRDK